VTTPLLDHRAFSMFAILFGYGMAWMVARQTAQGTPAEIRRPLRRRGLWLLAFGCLHALVLFPYEVLASYRFAALLTGWLLLRSNRAIAYPLLLLVVLGYRAGRAGLLDDPTRHRAWLPWIAAVGVAVSLAGALPLALTVVGALSPEPVERGLLMALQVLTGVCGGAGCAALFTLLAIRLERTRGPLTRAVAAVGERSLSCYLLNSALVAIVLHPDLVGLGPQVGVLGSLVVGLLVWLVSLTVASWLARAGRPGPADALLRKLVHRARRRSAGVRA
jgi:uncharacterized protein